MPPPGHDGDDRTWHATIPVLADFDVVAIAPGWSVAALDMGVIFALCMLALTVYALVLGA